MPFKIRKLPIKAVLISCSLLLSACLSEPDRPPIAVSQMTTPAPSPALPPLYCRVGRGSALFGHDWYDFNDALFILHRGDPVNLKISSSRNGGEMTIRAVFDGGGQKLIFCPFINAASSQQIFCTSLYALEEDLQEGIKRTFDIPGVVRGGGITCAYSQEKLRPLATPAVGGN